MNRRRFLSLSAAFACAPHLAVADVWSGRALGAECRVTLTGPRQETAAALARIPGILAGIEGHFSLFAPGSDLARLNATGNLDRPAAAVRALFDEADRAHALTGGLFDPTVQPLWQALATGRAPGPARALIGWNRIRRDAARITLAPGQQLTFNGIAQGFASDAVRADLASRGFTGALIDMGEIAALGGPFRIALEDPAAGPLGQLSVTGTALATSSPGALRLGKEAHILSPDGRRPLWSAVTIEADSAARADALSTAAVFMEAGGLSRLKHAAGLHRITVVDRAGNLRSL